MTSKIEPPTDEVASVGADEAEWWSGTKARVFISCGQNSDDERRRARDVRDAIRAQGFCPYLAIQVHSAQGLTEGIYPHLRSAEYFLFVDFIREKLNDGPDSRGSLFSSQELGIASYLDSEPLFFVELGIKKHDGIIGVIQGNPTWFSDRNALVAMIEHEVRESNWNARHRRELRIERDAGEFSESLVGGTLPARYFHATIVNLHHRTFATNCLIQIAEIRDLTRAISYSRDPVEVKWRHITVPTVSIPPGSRRQFDGLLVYKQNPWEGTLGVLNIPYVDSGDIIQQHVLHGPGDFEVDFVAYSREFSPARATLCIHLEPSIADVSVTLKTMPPTTGPGAAAKIAPRTPSATPENGREREEPRNNSRE
jgi:hypothetical protein